MWFRRKKTVTPAEVSAPVTKTESQDAGTPRKKILVVDDDPVVVKTLSLTLNAEGYNVVSAQNGAAAIALMRDERPDMLVVDVSLPADGVSGGAVTWDGFQVTQWLHRVNVRKIPALIISGTDRPEYQRRATDVGATGFLAKPLNKAQLLNSVQSALSQPQQEPGVIVNLRMAN